MYSRRILVLSLSAVAILGAQSKPAVTPAAYPKWETLGSGDISPDGKWLARLEPMKAVARTMEKHREGILAWFDSRISNGLIEGINATVQAAKARAHGYRNSDTLKAMTYLIAGKLDLRLPT